MYLIQILLPLYNNEGEKLHAEKFNVIRTELTEKFGGITAYSRSPATGLWKESENKTAKDEIIIYEIMTEEFIVKWWSSFKEKLEEMFEQDVIVIRSWKIDVME